MSFNNFKTAAELAAKADAYFIFIEGEYLEETIPEAATAKKTNSTKRTCIREAEPATIAGLALFLGFNSRRLFEDYEQNGRFAAVIKWARLRVEAYYEKKLHQQTSAGAIFALKSLGWNDKPEDKTTAHTGIKNLKIEIIETGPKPAGSEKEVAL